MRLLPIKRPAPDIIEVGLSFIYFADVMVPLKVSLMNCLMASDL